MNGKRDKKLTELKDWRNMIEQKLTEFEKILLKGIIGFVLNLTLIFITLKLVEVIDWPWPWVLGPLWIPFIVIVIIITALFPIAILVLIFRRKKKFKDSNPIEKLSKGN